MWISGLTALRFNTELFSVFRRRRRSRATRCWWVGSWCRVPAARSRSTASSCHSFSCREFTVCCGPRLHLLCDPACCTDTTTPPPPPPIISLAAWFPLQGPTGQTRRYFRPLEGRFQPAGNDLYLLYL